MLLQEAGKQHSAEVDQLSDASQLRPRVISSLKAAVHQFRQASPQHEVLLHSQAVSVRLQRQPSISCLCTVCCVQNCLYASECSHASPKQLLSYRLPVRVLHPKHDRSHKVQYFAAGSTLLGHCIKLDTASLACLHSHRDSRMVPGVGTHDSRCALVAQLPLVETEICHVCRGS